MTAIILCGRSGAAFAAELGSMKVSEEIDALRTMGFGPMRYLVLPRAIALMLVLPMLTLIGDFVGMLGGLVVGVVSLGLTVGGYLTETQTALQRVGRLLGAREERGLRARHRAHRLPAGLRHHRRRRRRRRRTTASVVSILFTLILIDAGFTIFFYVFDL